VAGHIFQARPVWIYTQSNITSISLGNVSKIYARREMVDVLINYKEYNISKDSLKPVKHNPTL
jgi:hypothetical protein